MITAQHRLIEDGYVVEEADRSYDTGQDLKLTLSAYLDMDPLLMCKMGKRVQWVETKWSVPHETNG